MMIRNRKFSIVDAVSHPFKTIAAKRKQKRATFFENLENYDEERINQRAVLLEKLRKRYEERKDLKKTTRNGSSNSKTEGRTDNDAGEKKSNNTAPASPNKTKKKMERPIIHVPKLSPDALAAVVEDLRHGRDKFSMTDAMSIISGATVLFSREPNVCRVYSHEDEDGFVIIVGDIHGQYYDLIHMFEKVVDQRNLAK